MRKFYFVIIWLLALTAFLVWPRGSYDYLKLNSVVEGNTQVLFEKRICTYPRNLAIGLTPRSYVQGAGSGIIKITLNDETIDSRNTLVNSSDSIQTQTTFLVLKTKPGCNKLKVSQGIDGDGKYVVASLGVFIK